MSPSSLCPSGRLLNFFLQQLSRLLLRVVPALSEVVRVDTAEAEPTFASSATGGSGHPK